MFLMMMCSVVYGYTYSDYTWINNPANGHQYALTLNFGTWEQAEAEAQALNPSYNLVTIDSAEENSFLSNFIRGVRTRNHFDPGNNIAWIGLEFDSGTWKWASGETVTYTNYYPSWPEGGIKAYIMGNDHPSPGKWSANYMHESIPEYNARGIIEVIPEPATLLLLGLGGMILRKRKA